jgi:3-oxoacyl-[acyl-carrier protein] reductase
MRLEYRVAVVTGGGHGIGRVYCQGLAKEGARVVVADVDLPAAEKTKDLIENEGGMSLAIEVDVADEQSTVALADSTMRTYGRIDILVNNAAIFATVPISRVAFDKIPLEEWDRVMAVNLKGMWLCCRAVVPFMKKQNYGRIVNISSNSIFSGRGMRIHYVTSKAGVIGFSRTLARELGDFGITVNAIAPGSTLSESRDDAKAVAMRQAAVEARCLKRIQYPEDLVGTLVVLCSHEGDFITGQTLIVDGGDSMI